MFLFLKTGDVGEIYDGVWNYRKNRVSFWVGGLKCVLF